MGENTKNHDLVSISSSDAWDNRICRPFFSGYCPQGALCKLKHIQPVREIVCKAFLLYGDCKKGPLCQFLHELILEKLPECRKFLTDGACNNSECKFRHSATKKEAKECAYYNMGIYYAGFCEQGKFCKFKHIKRDLCFEFFEIGRCASGEACKRYHLKSIAEEYLAEAFYKLHPECENVKFEDLSEYCPRCMNFGHSASQCAGMFIETGIRCFRCGNLGHKANSCLGHEQRF